MRICKYCKKPISDDDVWNPDRDGNGYHHDCLCEMQSRLRDKQIYNKGRAEVLDKIIAEIEQIEINGYIRDVECFSAGINTALNVINKYRAESELPS